ncbi:MAG: hypothetical protein JRN09_00215 [Nitrososphaerota archaeon]|nr:hypothetical protein [Nitrososphaerota archaeon]
MEPRQEKKLTRAEFDKITSQMRALVGDKLCNHKDGDAERLLFREIRRGSNTYQDKNPSRSP